MSVILEAQVGSEVINIQEFHASPEGKPFSWDTSRKFRIGERVRYVSYFQDEHYKNHPGLGWMVVIETSDGTRYAATHNQFVTEGNAGSGVAASIRGGTVVVRGDAAARAGLSMKGGTLLIGGNCGYMAGFMMQKGRIVICGDAGDALADSMYEGVVFVGGKIAALGNDAVVSEPTSEDRAALADLLARFDLPAPAAFQKIVSGRKLWNFDRKEL